MSLFKIAWRSIQQRGLASVLTTLSMALGVMLVVAVLLIAGVIRETFQNNASLGYNLIVGAKGGKLQLVLNTVYYLSTPVENIPYGYYQRFLPASERGDGQDGEWALMTEFAIPVCLGDYYQEFRVIGTTPRMFDNYVYDREHNRKYQFAAGRNFQRRSQEYGYFEAVIGARVAKQTGLKIGDSFSPSHGATDGKVHDDDFYVVGILAPTGTPCDRGVFVNMEGFYLLDNHAKPLKDGVGLPAVAGNWPSDERCGGTKLSPERQQLQALPTTQREVTALLLRTTRPVVAIMLQTQINEGNVAQAVQPIAEIQRLFVAFVEPIQYAFLGITAVVCIVSGVSILVSIYNSMSDRRHEIAVMRALGAGRRTVLTVVVLEAILLALAGGAVGWISGHLLIGVLGSSTIEDRTGVQIGLFDMAPGWKPLQRFEQLALSQWEVSTELILVPGLILLAVLVGLLPALTAYRTDVSKSLSN